MRYAAFLRGVNVGAHNRIRMADFKRALQEIGFSRVETYIQSGNAAFDSDEEEAALAAQIKGKLAAMGVNADVVLRSADEMRAIVEGLPFFGAESRRRRMTSGRAYTSFCFPLGPTRQKSARTRTTGQCFAGARRTCCSGGASGSRSWRRAS